MPCGKSGCPNLRSPDSTLGFPPLFPIRSTKAREGTGTGRSGRERRALSVGSRSVCVMAEQSKVRHLRAVGTAPRAEVVGDDADREAYWARLEQLRVERQRLRAG